MTQKKKNSPAQTEYEPTELIVQPDTKSEKNTVSNKPKENITGTCVIHREPKPSETPDFISAYFTDAGTVKRTNQDSICIKAAKRNNETHILAAVCDGLGGLPEGETASAYTVSRLSEWFEKTYPVLLRQNMSITALRSELDSCLHDISDRINRYGISPGSTPGTTMTLLLYSGLHGKIITAHIGDTRLYRISTERTELLTEDHSIVSEEVRSGKITEKEAEADARQNQLTQCIGAGLTDISFDYSIIDAEKETVFLICSDGFRRMITEEEISSALAPVKIRNTVTAEKELNNLAELCMNRNETDNISALIIMLREKDGI